MSISAKTLQKYFGYSPCIKRKKEEEEKRCTYYVCVVFQEVFLGTLCCFKLKAVARSCFSTYYSVVGMLHVIFQHEGLITVKTEVEKKMIVENVLGCKMPLPGQ